MSWRTHCAMDIAFGGSIPKAAGSAVAATAIAGVMLSGGYSPKIHRIGPHQSDGFGLGHAEANRGRIR
jgi:hypothetical protein